MTGERLHDLGGFLALYGLETLWMAAVLLPVIALAAWILRAHAARVRGRLWWGYLLLIPVLPWLAQSAGDAGVPQRAIAPVHAPVTIAEVPAVEPSAGAHVPGNTPAATSARPGAPSAVHRDGPTPQDLPPARIAAPAPRQRALPAVLGALYLLGLTAFLIPIALGHVRVVQWRFRSSPCDDRRIQTAFEDAARALGLKRPARVRVCPAIAAPATIKLLRTAVLVPPRFAGAVSPAELFAVAVHETEHVRRRDAAKLQALSLLRAVLWCHPLAWLAASRILHLMECNADEAVVNATRAPLPYAHLLTRLAGEHDGFVPLGAVGLLWGRGGLTARVAAVLSGPAPRRMTLTALAAVAALLILGLGAVSASPLRQLSDRAAVRQAVEALPKEGSFERVLQFEVTDAETGEVLPEVRYWAGWHITPDWRYEMLPEKQSAPGRFEHRVTEPWSFVSFQVGAPGYGTYHGQRSLFNTPPELPVRIALHRAMTLSGLVVDEGGAPIEGAELDISSAPGQLDPRQVYGRHAARTDAEGRWQMDDIPSNTESVFINLHHPGHAAQQVDIWPRPVHTVQGAVFRMAPGEPFGGRVVDTQGAPVAGASVEIFSGLSTTTDDEGHFLFPHMAPESFERGNVVTVRAEGFALDTRFIKEDGIHTGHEIMLHPARPLQVRLRDRRGRPLSNTEIWLNSESGFANRILSNADGIISLNGVWPDTEWRFSAVMWPGGPLGPSEMRTLTPGDTVHEVRLQPSTMVNIIALDADTGQRIEHFRVTSGHTFYNTGTGEPLAWWERWWPWSELQRSITWSHEYAEDASRVYRLILWEYDGHHGDIYRVEAEGYYPFDSREIPRANPAADIVARLTPGEPLRLAVATPSGEPATGVQGLWAPHRAYVGIENGRRFNASSQGFVREGDEGVLIMNPIDRTTHDLIIIANEGYALLEGAAVADGNEIHLTPWGRIEGAIVPEMREPVQFGVLALAEVLSRWNRVSFLSRAYPGDNGQVLIERVPAGENRLGVAGSHFGGWQRATPWETVEAAPGETVSIQLGEIPLKDKAMEPIFGIRRNR